MGAVHDGRRTGEMQRLSDGLPSKSEKIRTLGRAGYTRSEIAEFLGVKYQFVRNVLVDAERAAKDSAPPAMAAQSGTGNYSSSVKMKLGANGELRLPEPIRAVLNVKEGDTLWLFMEDGELRVTNSRGIVRRVQAMVRKFVPEGVSLVDELIAERRREVEKEDAEEAERSNG